MDWNIPKMWEGGECWIIGGGPSMPRQFGVPESTVDKVYSGDLPMSAYSPFLSPIHSKHVIAVNAAFLIGEWMDLVFFGDGGFYFKNRRELSDFPKIRVSCNPNLKTKSVQGVRFVSRDGKHPHGISSRRNRVSWNGNTGAAAINLAYHLGVKRICLLGFDMKLGEDERQHFHNHYRKGKNRDARKLPFHRHLRGFPMIAQDARKLGLEVLNINPDSAILELPKLELKDVL